jgi:DoxX-like protein
MNSGLNAALWIGQLVLAGVFIFSGQRKIFQYDKPGGGGLLPSPSTLSRRVAGIIGTCEILAGIGVVLPWLVGVLPSLTPLAALAIAVLMVLAAGYHAVRREYKRLLVPGLLCLLALFVAYGRS